GEADRWEAGVAIEAVGVGGEGPELLGGRAEPPLPPVAELTQSERPSEGPRGGLPTPGSEDSQKKQGNACEAISGGESSVVSMRGANARIAPPPAHEAPKWLQFLQVRP